MSDARASGPMTNRERLARVLRDLDRIAQNDAISPTPYEHLRAALFAAQEAGKFALDMRERDGIRGEQVFEGHHGLERRQGERRGMHRTIGEALDD